MDNQKYWVLGLCPSSGILDTSSKPFRIYQYEQVRTSAMLLQQSVKEFRAEVRFPAGVQTGSGAYSVSYAMGPEVSFHEGKEDGA
jgi:hypothetical protein